MNTPRESPSRALVTAPRPRAHGWRKKWLPSIGAGPSISSTFTVERVRTKKERLSRGLSERRRPRLLDTLDLAERWQAELKTGGVNQRGIAAREVITPARVSQILAVLRLHPAIVAYLRVKPLTTERALRPLMALPRPEQLREAPRVVSGWAEHRGQERAGRRRQARRARGG